MEKILITLFTICFLQSQTDEMYIGKEKVTKLKTIKKASLFNDDIIVYGKYIRSDLEMGEIEFLGNNGITYTDPTYVKALKNEDGYDYLHPRILASLKNKKREVAISNLKSQCEKNSESKVMVLTFQNDFYGLTEDVENALSQEACFNVYPNEKGLEYIFNSNNNLKDLNDFTLQNIGEEIGLDYIIYGYASEYDIPYKYAPTTPNQTFTSYNSNNWFDVLFISLNNWSVTSSEMEIRSYASLEAGRYVTLTYFSINIDNGEKQFLTKNKTVLKKG